MSLFAIDILCPQCDRRWDDLVDRSLDSWELRFECPRCGETECKRTMSAPNAMRASHPDGYSRGDGYKALKDAAKLKTERASLPHDKRDDITRAIKQTEQTAKRLPVKRHLKD